jgi:predicted nucleic acid-binding protein
MILVDAGPLIAVLDRDDPDYALCTAALHELRGPLLTTWPAFTEAAYLLGDRIGWTAQDLLWRLVLREDLILGELDVTALERSRALMEKYRDLPMDLADSTLVALAEVRGIKRVFTLDSDFRIYRLKGNKAFEIIP